MRHRRLDPAKCRSSWQTRGRGPRGAGPISFRSREPMIETIVVGTDGSHTAAVAVSEAVELAKSLGARLHVVSAYQPLSGVRVAGEDPEFVVAAAGPTVEVDAVLQRAAGAAARGRAFRLSAMRAKGARPRRFSTWRTSSAPV